MKVKLLYLLSLCIALILLSCLKTQQRFIGNRPEKFEPEKGKYLVFIGQDMEAIGGIDGYNGYCDYFDTPAGITVYTSITSDNNYNKKDLAKSDGIFSMADWGSGHCYADKQIRHPRFRNSVLAIGLSIVDNEKAIYTGQRDSMIIRLGNWIKSLEDRPVFLRIGYEFDGDEWNHYNCEEYILAWRYIVDRFNALSINNIAFVWQSKGGGTTMKEMEKWYPGDEYVNWCGYSYFANPDKEMIHFAKKHKKPVFIAELTPVIQDGNKYLDSDMKNPESAKMIWDKWFTEFFKTIEENKDVIKAFSYINCDWPSQVMWVNNPVFNKVDSRLQEDEYVSRKWIEKISSDEYLKPTDKLFDILWHRN